MEQPKIGKAICMPYRIKILSAGLHDNKKSLFSEDFFLWIQKNTSHFFFAFGIYELHVIYL